ncbi:TetR/AcrR family transcriptional regulator [Nocardia sp. NPDC059239]|uniref:TetR/AcrR family transcriptional regulator n=1 Tax=unclassified Nocardia TaxID=2637762 RepID=UPI0036955975
MAGENATALNDPPPKSTSEIIVETGLKLFSEIGYDGASMRQIASIVGIQPASLYNHYASKEELLWSIVEDALVRIRSYQRRAFTEEATTVDRLRAFVRLHVRFHAEHRQMARVVNNNMESLSPAHYSITAQRREEFEHGLRQILQFGSDEELFHIRDIRHTSYAVLDMGTGVSNWYRPDGLDPLSDILDAYEEMALRIVGYAHPLTPLRTDPESALHR